MMLILALGMDVQIHAGGITQTLEEVEKHLCRHLAHLLTVELGIPYQPRTSTEIEGYLTEAVVHGKTVAITLNAALVAQCIGDAFTDDDGSVLDGMMLIHI